jgi:Ca2+-binding EF-hand superfamily protein
MKRIVFSTALLALAPGLLSAQESPLAKPLRAFDTNNDGKLTGEEVVQAQQAFNRGGKKLENGGRPPKEFAERRKRSWLEQQAKSLDLNGNGSLEENESKRAEIIWNQISAEFDKVRADLLRKYDKDNDGELNEQERNASRGEYEARRKAIEEKVMAANPRPAAP